MTQELDAGVPWVMCQQADAPANIVNNSFRIHSSCSGLILFPSTEILVTSTICKEKNTCNIYKKALGR